MRDREKDEGVKGKRDEGKEGRRKRDKGERVAKPPPHRAYDFFSASAASYINALVLYKLTKSAT